MYLLTDHELLKLSIIPKSEITLKVHFSIKHLERIVDRIVRERSSS